MFPNPPSDLIRIHLDNVLISENVQLKIIDMLGISVYQRPVTDFDMDVSEYHAGDYTLTIKNGIEELTSQKLLLLILNRIEP